MDINTLNQIEFVGSSLAKEKFLARLDESTLKFLRWALDPMITFGITFQANPVRGDEPSADFWGEFDELCKKLSKRELTGNAAESAMFHLLVRAPSDDAAMWAARIINKDLRSGFSHVTVNKVFPGFIEPFACSLAKTYDPDKHEINEYWCVQPKLDGLRMIVIDGKAYTRNGRTIESVGHVLNELSELSFKYVFDGEIMGSTEFNEDSGKIRKKGNGPDLSLVYNIFDCVRRDQWRGLSSNYLTRKTQLEKIFADYELKYSRLVESIDVPGSSAEALFKVRDEFIKKGYEGAMLKDLGAPYIYKRSDFILKLKDFLDADGKIVSVFEGKGRLRGKLGGVSVDFDGVETRIGSGFSDEQRETLWKRRNEIIGKTVEVKYQNKAPSGALRFGVFLRFRPDKD